MTAVMLDPRDHARRGDPDTSHDAADLLGDKTTMLNRLLTTFRRDELTAEQASVAAGYTAADGAWKRVSDLARMGLIEDTGHRRVGSAGRRQIVWRITRTGWLALVIWARRGHR